MGERAMDGSRCVWASDAMREKKAAGAGAGAVSKKRERET